MMRWPALLVLATTGVAVAGSVQPARGATYDAIEAFPGLRFARPVDLQPGPGGRLFVVEQDGVVRVFHPDSVAVGARVFLDIRDRVDTRGNETGLLGLALSRGYSQSGEYFVYYTAVSDSGRVGRLSRFTGNDAASESVVLDVRQPWSNHNGGQVAFGPDGFLYLGLGDGGGGGDPRGHGQDLSTLLGSIIRIDVSATPYAVPADNPFAGNILGYREEIWAYGLRNPWRFSFDLETDWLWAADVGQVSHEEIDVIEKGKNYGWNCREGFHGYSPETQRSSACATVADGGGFAPPVWAYGRELGMSVTGGYVYRGSVHEELVGWYIFADYVSGRIWALFYDGMRVRNRLLADTDLLISSFGIDQDGELYICDHNAGGGETGIYTLQERHQ